MEKVLGMAAILVCVLGAVLLLGPAQANAQVTYTATLSGVVTDPSGAAVPGAQVVAKSVATSVEYKATTSQSGAYLLMNLPPAVYDMRASATGFQVAAVSNITLNVSQSSTQNFTLTLGSQKQTVTVSGAPPLLQTGTASLGTIVSRQQIVDLPLDGRHFEQLVRLVPGASPTDVSQGGGTSLNGQMARATLWYVDGIPDTAPFFNSTSVEPSIDVIQEFRVMSHNDEASVGMTTGGVINVATKSGTDRFHGDAYEFNRNKVFSARDFYAPVKTPNFNQNQFGFTLGGPIPKLKRTWFFGGWEGYRFVQGSSNFARVPTATEWNGDFSSFLGAQVGTDALGRPVYQNEIFNPFTGRATTAGQIDPQTGLVATSTGYVREPFTNNIINPSILPGGAFNKIAAMKAWYPTPNLPTIAGTYQPNFINTQSATNRNSYMDFRIDHRFSDRDTVFGRLIGDPDTGSFSPSSLPSDPFVSFGATYNLGVNWLHAFSPTLIMNLRWGEDFGNGAAHTAQGVGTNVSTADMYHLTGFDVPGGAFTLGAGGTYPEMPAVGMYGYSGTGASASASAASSATSLLHPSDVQFVGDVTKVKGKHTIKFGADWFHFHSVVNSSCPSVSFGLPQTGDPSNFSVTGNGLASFLLGVPGGGLQYGGYSGADMTFSMMGGYIEDSFKVTPKLTLNYGLRYDFTTPIVEAKNGFSAFDWDTGLFELAGSTPPPSCASTNNARPCIPGGTLPANVVMLGHRYMQNPVYDNVQPRLGFAYQLSNRTVIRAGGGAYFNSLSDQLQNAQALRASWPFGLIASPAPDLNQTVFTVYAQNLLPPTAAPAPTPFPAGSRVNSSKIKDSYTASWNLDVQHQLTNSLTISGAYVGDKGSRMPYGFLSNTALTPGPGPINSRTPFPLLQADAFGTRSIGSSWYDSFQLKAEERASHGLSFIASYTWSRSIDTGCSGYEGVEGCQVENPYNVLNDKGLSSYDVPQVLTFSYVWELPFGKDRAFASSNRVVNAVIGNWQLNGIFSGSSGSLVTVLEGDQANTGNFFGRPDQVGNPIPTNRTPMNWWNASAFALSPNCRVVTPCRFGTVGRNTLRGPRVFTWDSSIFREFPISERLGKIQLRGEFFNTLNHTTFQTTSFPAFGTFFNSGTFGELLSTRPARQVQIGLKWIF